MPPTGTSTRRPIIADAHLRSGRGLRRQPGAACRNAAQLRARGEDMKGTLPPSSAGARMIELGHRRPEIDLLDFFAELTIYTSTACPDRTRKFRNQLDSRFRQCTTCSSAERSTLPDPVPAYRKLPDIDEARRPGRPGAGRERRIANPPDESDHDLQTGPGVDHR